MEAIVPGATFVSCVVYNPAYYTGTEMCNMPDSPDLMLFFTMSYFAGTSVILLYSMSEFQLEKEKYLLLARKFGSFHSMMMFLSATFPYPADTVFFSALIETQYTPCWAFSRIAFGDDLKILPCDDLRIADLLLPHPPMTISYIGSFVCAESDMATCMSFSAFAVKKKVPVPDGVICQLEFHDV